MSAHERSPFDALGEAKIRAIVERFYDAMNDDDPVLLRMHEVDDTGRVSRASRDRFALFFVGWLGGPQDYMAQHGHPRLRMRHGHLPVDQSMRDAWLRCMSRAFDEEQVEGPLREFLDARLFEVADMLRNRRDAEE